MRTLWILCFFLGCGSGSEADRLGVGAECTEDDECPITPDDIELACLTDFAGGYCGLQGCEGNDDCPDQSACVTHWDEVNYCFRLCTDKAECNENRSVDVESNCSSNITFVDEDTVEKACVPSSSGVR